MRLKSREVTAWYSSGEDCQSLLRRYHVDYVIYGPEEARLGDAPCLSDLHEVTQSGDVTLYAP